MRNFFERFRGNREQIVSPENPYGPGAIESLATFEGRIEKLERMWQALESCFSAEIEGKFDTFLENYPALLYRFEASKKCHGETPLHCYYANQTTALGNIAGSVERHDFVVGFEKALNDIEHQLTSALASTPKGQTIH